MLDQKRTGIYDDFCTWESTELRLRNTNLAPLVGLISLGLESLQILLILGPKII